ncbi:HAD-IA family hydrolase [Heliorestis acidaminivorans]|uniref:HAD-IA family hydrolase n=1 Tax=Heliorestis acidaminivorans TaxID=553427 RepID=A0A6I0ETZ4_9FIRM|nr:HAD-IA family hydrolase [Heliorestis acidaminivorans]KAB2953664.1 HAD-IA family hydrolase [Heliorestis acidaminivorans]
MKQNKHSKPQSDLVIKPQEYKTVLFDQDGTLIDSIELIHKSYRQVFDYLELPWKEGEVMKHLGRSLVEISELYAKDSVQAAQFRELYSYFYRQDHDEYTKAFPEATAFLQNLQAKGFVLGVVTGKRHDPARESLEYTGLWPYMKNLVGADEVEQSKPAPYSLLKALDQLDSKASESLYIGDGAFDMTAAKSAGMLAIAVTWGIGSEEELREAGADIIVKSWKELNNLFELN